jgi:hypothetical protein
MEDIVLLILDAYRAMSILVSIMPAALTTALDTLHHTAERIAIGLAPEDHAVATATTFWQIGDLAGDLPLTLGDLALGLELLVSPRAFAESPTTTAYRKTCDDVAALLRQATAGDPRRLAAVLRVVAKHCAGSRDPHHVALGVTAAREAAELEAV